MPRSIEKRLPHGEVHSPAHRSAVFAGARRCTGGEWEGFLFRSLADIVYASGDFEAIHEAVVNAAPRLVRGCDHASLMLQRGGRFETVAATDDVARRIDALERELGEGPCVDAIVDDTAYIDPDLTDGSQWPGLARRMLEETPVRGAAGFRLLVQGAKTGSLNLFSDTPGAFDEQSVNEGAVLSSFLSIALLAAHEQQDAQTLRLGLESNREIGKAVGLLMAFHKIGDDEAFEMLRKASQDMNMKLSEVARQVVEHHRNRPS